MVQSEWKVVFFNEYIRQEKDIGKSELLSKESVGGTRGVMVIVLGNGHEFKSWTRLTVFHIALIPLGKVWI